MRKELCPSCGRRMIEDAAEEITELPDGSMQIETIYPALVCSESCGYYEKLEEQFND
jgi:YgiT-type zinc finger domain-containing protein